jgi:predicted transcriptional regulator
MTDETIPPKRRLNAHGRELRRARILARTREGMAYDEIAHDEGLTPERIRQIVRETLDQRLPDEDTDHAKLQLSRLQPAMRITAAAVEKGDVSAVSPLLKVLDRLDRYQKTAKVNQVYDDEARKKLFEKLNRVASNLGLAVVEDPAKTKPQAALEAPPPPQAGEPKPAPAGDKEKIPWGVGGSG